MNQGGAVMWIILICSVLGGYIILERLLAFHKAQIDVPEFLHGLSNILRRNNAVEAMAICEETPGPVAHVLRAAILRCDEDEASLRRAVEEVSLAEVPRLERGLKTLATIAHIAPLLGLLGTVVGMIGAFQAMQDAGPFVSTTDLTGNIRKALLTTAAGLSVSIPAYAFYNFFVGRVQGFLLDMEKAAAEMIYFLTHTPERITPPQIVPGSEAEDSVGDEV
jgi:biopolymer transport protein ExbB